MKTEGEFTTPAESSGDNAPAGSRQRPFEFRGSLQLEYETQGYVFLPADYDADSERHWPLLYFLHGAGERGPDLTRVKLNGPSRFLDSRPDFPFIVLSPQCPPGRWWETNELITILDVAMREYRIDPDRVYLTGLSMGGFGTWELAIEYPERFAAIAPICGGGNARKTVMLRDMPVWAFHGDADPIVALDESQRMIEALKFAGGKEVKLDIYPGVGHNSWVQAYDNEELYAWFLRHRLSDRTELHPQI